MIDYINTTHKKKMSPTPRQKRYQMRSSKNGHTLKYVPTSTRGSFNEAGKRVKRRSRYDPPNRVEAMVNNVLTTVVIRSVDVTATTTSSVATRSVARSASAASVSVASASTSTGKPKAAVGKKKTAAAKGSKKKSAVNLGTFLFFFSLSHLYVRKLY